MNTIFTAKDANGAVGTELKLVSIEGDNEFVHVRTTGGSPRLSPEDRKGLSDALLSTLPAENSVAPATEPTFKIGDTVQINGFGPMTDGAIGVIEDDVMYLEVRVTDDTNAIDAKVDTVWPCTADELTHYTPKQPGVFNVGDRVVLMDDFDPEEEDTPALGSLGTVTELFGDDIVVLFDHEDEDGFLCVAGELEHAATDDYSIFLERIEKALHLGKDHPHLPGILTDIAVGFLVDESPEAKLILRTLVHG